MGRGAPPAPGEADDPGDLFSSLRAGGKGTSGFPAEHDPHGGPCRRPPCEGDRGTGKGSRDAVRENAAAPVIAQVHSPGMQRLLDFPEWNGTVEIDGQVLHASSP